MTTRRPSVFTGTSALIAGLVTILVMGPGQTTAPPGSKSPDDSRPAPLIRHDTPGSTAPRPDQGELQGESLRPVRDAPHPTREPLTDATCGEITVTIPQVATASTWAILVLHDETCERALAPVSRGHSAPIDRYEVPKEQLAVLVRAQADDWVAFVDGSTCLTQQVSAMHVAAGELRFSPEPSKVLSGLVVGGEPPLPVPHALVSVDSRGPGLAPPPLLQALLPQIHRRGSTDVDGKFHVELPSETAYRLQCSSVGFCPSRYEFSDIAEAPERIVLFSAISLGGCVIDDSGEPVAHATITIGPIGPIPVPEPVVLTTDAEGQFSTAAAPRTHVAIVARRDGFAPARVDIDLGTPVGSSVVLRLIPDSMLAGTVVDEMGDPVAGASVLAASLRDRLVTGTCTTGPNGGFNIPWAAAGHEYRIEVTAPGFDPCDLGPFSPPQDRLLIRVVHRASLVVRVTDDAGAPVRRIRFARIADVPSEVHDTHWWLHAAVQDLESEAGRYLIEGMRHRPHQVFVIADGFGSAVSRVTPAPEGRGFPDLDLELRPEPPLTARLVDHRGRPIAGARAVVATRDCFGAPRPTPAARHSTSDDSGELVVDGVPGVPFQLVLQRTAFVPVISQVIHDTTRPVDLTWPRVGDLRVRIRSTKVERLSSICLRVDPSTGGSPVDVRPDENGVLDLENVPSGGVRLVLVDEWASTDRHTMATRERTVEILPGRVNEFDWDLASSACAEGWIEIPMPFRSNRWIVRATQRVLAETSDARTNEWITSSVELGGRFVLCGLLPGPWRVEAISTEPGLLASAVTEFEFARDSIHEIRMEPSLRRRSLEVTSARDGRPLRGAYLERSAAGLPATRVLLTDEGALEVLGETPVGEWHVCAPGMVRQRLPELPGDGSHRTIALTDAARLDLDVESPSGEFDVPPALEVFSQDGALLHRETGSSLYLDDLPPGLCRVEVRAGDAGASWSGRLAAARTERVVLTLGPRGQIAVAVVPSNARPDGESHVRVSSLETDELGNPSFSGILRLGSDGTARVSVPIGWHAVDYAGQRVSVHVAAGAVADATFTAD